ncbi:MAG: c-type cytochrome [Anaerolineae bacterium]|nr:c-type cytochrome [Anaerolineae bacterium]
MDAAALDAATVASQSFNLSTGEVIFRWLSYLSSAALAGGVMFVITVWNPAFQKTKKELDIEVSSPWRMLTAGALFVLVFANILGLLAQAGQVTGLGFAFPWHPAVSQLLFATKYGALWLGRFALILVVTRFLVLAKSDRDRWISLSATLLILFTFSLNSHAAAEPRPFFPIAADWLHLVGASVWVGGLIFFVGGVWATREVPAPPRTRLTSHLIPRFSALAISSVGLIGLTGVYSAYLRVGSFDALTTTLYGNVLVVKTLLFLPMLMLGAINLLNTTPTMRKAAEQTAGDGGLVQRFRNLISTEIVFAVFLLLTVGLFTAVPPARAIATETTIRQTAQAGDLEFEIEISPGKVGINTFQVLVTAGGSPVEGAREVSLQFTPTGVDLPPSKITLEEVGGGLYTTEGAFLSLPDAWQVQVAVRRANEFDTFVNFAIPVGTSVLTTFPWNRLNAFLLILAAALLLQAVRPLEKNKARALKTVRAPAIMLVVAGAIVFFLPSKIVEETQVNPVPPNRESIAAGQAIYREQCLACHGPTGRGDGPVGLTLNPPPADLYQHTQPGVHPDGRLYDWITNGFSGNSQMPVFKDILTEDDRWNVVNYIRTFARGEE